MKDIYIRLDNEQTYKSAITSALISPWMFSFPNRIAPPKYEDAKKWYHGNSKLLLHLFFNDLTNKYEMQISTATIAKSYPQNKKLNIVNWDDMSYEYCAGVFGEA